MARTFVAILLVCAVLASPVRAASPTTGAIYLASLPAGADVWLDGNYVGTSPVLVDGLSSGHHTASLTKAGWNVKEVDFDLFAGTTSIKGVTLERSAGKAPRSTGTLAVRGLGSGAHMLVDGAPLGRGVGAAALLPAGSHIVVVRTPGGSVSRHVTIYPDMTTNLIMHGDSDVRDPGVLAPVEAYAPEATVWINAPRFSLTYFKHAVKGTIGSQRVLLDGSAGWYDTAPTLIGGKLYLPMSLIKKLNDEGTKGK